MSPGAPREIVRLADIVTTEELLELGRSPSQIRTMARRGQLVRLRRGCYATKKLAEPVLQLGFGNQFLLAAAAIKTRPGSVASHQTAARIHELDMLAEPGGLVTLTRPPGQTSGSVRPGLRLHSADLPAGHVTNRFGVPVTTVARTVIDLARCLAFREGVVVADSALHHKLTSARDLREVVAECRQWRGVRRAARVVAFADGLAESPLESIARVVFDDVGLPRPELQIPLVVAGTSVRVDFFWRRFLTIAEVDGALKYADPMRARLQLRRDKKLRDAGYEVVHFDWQEITEAPEEVAASIRAAFRRGTLRQ
jgi:predicted transcriptional regulator of viral defense system